MPGIRPATPQDVEAVARLFRVVRTACLPYLPDLHTPAAESGVLPRPRVPWLHRLDSGRGAHRRLLRLAARLGGPPLHPPERHGQGLGTALLARAMAAHPHLRLWAFQRNVQALRFYAARGFRVIERTDGSRNEEREPDALLEWLRA